MAAEEARNSRATVVVWGIGAQRCSEGVNCLTRHAASLPAVPPQPCATIEGKRAPFIREYDLQPEKLKRMFWIYRPSRMPGWEGCIWSEKPKLWSGRLQTSLELIHNTHLLAHDWSFVLLCRYNCFVGREVLDPLALKDSPSAMQESN